MRPPKAWNRRSRASACRKVLLAPVEIAGYYASLEAALCEAGIEAHAVDLEGHRFRYGSDERPSPWVVRLARSVSSRRRRSAGGRFAAGFWRLADGVARVLLVAWAIWGYDILVFAFGATFLGLRELPLLRRLGKRLVFVFHGSDARPPYIDGVRVAPDRGTSVADYRSHTLRMKRSIRRIEQYADVVIAQPAFSHFFERPVISFFAIGLPHRDPVRSVPRHDSDGTIRVLHSPSDPVVKGTERVREVIAGLRSEGVDVELIELQGVPNSVVLDQIAQCDFVVDQVYSDAPMVGFATEAAVAGRPAVVGGYAWPENHRIFGQVLMPPVEECSPEMLADAIRRLAIDRAHREDLGRRAQHYVATEWSRTEVARRFMLAVDGAPPAEWYFDPRELRYVEGCGLSRAQARDSVARLLDAGGPGALCLSDKPELEQMFMDFAGAAPGGPNEQQAVGTRAP